MTMEVNQQIHQNWGRNLFVHASLGPKGISQVLATQSVVRGPAVFSHPGSVIGMQTPNPHSGPTESESAEQSLQVIYMDLKV